MLLPRASMAVNFGPGAVVSRRESASFGNARGFLAGCEMALIHRPGKEKVRGGLQEVRASFC